MKIINGGREYGKFYPLPATSDALEVSFDETITWLPLVPGTEDANGNWSANPAGTVHAILCATPLSSSNPLGTVVLPVGVSQALVRRVDNPEIVIREIAYNGFVEVVLV